MSNERYRHGDIECIDAIKAALTPEEFRGFCKGNVIKYIWRERYKGGNDDFKKALDYIMWAASTDEYIESGICDTFIVDGILRDFGVDIAHALDADPDATVPEAIIAEYAAKLRLRED